MPMSYSEIFQCSCNNEYNVSLKTTPKKAEIWEVIALHATQHYTNQLFVEPYKIITGGPYYAKRSNRLAVEWPADDRWPHMTVHWHQIVNTSCHVTSVCFVVRLSYFESRLVISFIHVQPIPTTTIVHDVH